MRGRKPTPTHLKLLHGNPGKRRLNPAEPFPVEKPPTCPSHLCPLAKAEWRRLAGQLTVLRILTDLDRAVLAGYCQAYGRWVEAERKLSETPMLIKLPSGYVQQNPWLTIANKRMKLMHKYLAEFGLSPVARSRVSISPTASDGASSMVCWGRSVIGMSILTNQTNRNDAQIAIRPLLAQSGRSALIAFAVG